MKNQSCKTCAYAEWTLTKNGKRRFNLGGICTYPLDYIPECATFNKLTIYRDSGQSCLCHRPEEYKNTLIYRKGIRLLAY